MRLQGGSRNTKHCNLKVEKRIKNKTKTAATAETDFFNLRK